jgi:hypothetical protein
MLTETLDPPNRQPRAEQELGAADTQGCVKVYLHIFFFLSFNLLMGFTVKNLKQ